MTKVKPKDKPHYVNNREFSEAVMDYAIEARDCRQKEKKVPTVPDYIAKCFIRILFSSYTLVGANATPFFLTNSSIFPK